MQSSIASNVATATASDSCPLPLPTSSPLGEAPPLDAPSIFPEDLLSKHASIAMSNSSLQEWSKLLAGLAKKPAALPTITPINNLMPLPKPHVKNATTKKATLPVPNTMMVHSQHARKTPSGKEITPLTVDANGKPTFDVNGNPVTSTGKHKQGKENTTCVLAKPLFSDLTFISAKKRKK
ncbi:hypothetical protein C0989_007006 [Termitomyces sp. Mn162]|nr:hypothetical protein C0989_007006 [Termitomyces sp. Mn162]